MVTSDGRSKGSAALGELARNNKEIQDAISRMGGLKLLVQLLDT